MSVKTKIFSLMAVVVVLLLPFRGFSQSKCPDFPKIDFWEGMTHDKVRQHVNDKLSGDWLGYIEKLKLQQISLARINGRGKAARVSRGGRRITLKGAGLSQYLGFSQDRIAIIECLAKEELALKSPKDRALKKPLNPVKPDTEASERTYLYLSQDLLKKLRQEAARRSRVEKRKVSVNEVIIDTVKRGLKK